MAFLKEKTCQVLCIRILRSADRLGEAAWSEEEAPGVLLASDMIFNTRKFRLKQLLLQILLQVSV
jgi:hypothetical protein